MQHDVTTETFFFFWQLAIRLKHRLSVSTPQRCSVDLVTLADERLHQNSARRLYQLRQTWPSANVAGGSSAARRAGPCSSTDANTLGALLGLAHCRREGAEARDPRPVDCVV